MYELMLLLVLLSYCIIWHGHLQVLLSNMLLLVELDAGSES